MNLAVVPKTEHLEYFKTCCILSRRLMRITKPDERKEADMNWEELAGRLKKAGWRTLGNGCLRKGLDGMEYRIWKNSENTAVIGYGAYGTECIQRFGERLRENQDGFVLGEAFGNYIVLKYKDERNNRAKKFQYDQVGNALEVFENQLREAGVLSGGGTASVEDREVRPPRSVAAASASQQVNNNITFEQALKEIPDSAFQQGKGFWATKENPWFEFTMNGGDEFVLTDDKDAIASYNEGKENKDTYIHLDAPPQPYIGDPQAKRWLLLMNPSYSPVDVAEITGRIPENLKELINKKGLKYINFIERSSPERRRGLMEDQLSFNQKSSFYPLEPAFDVWAYDGESPQGSYHWWRRNLLNGNICGRKPEKLSEFFVLESFPYHSRNFGDIKPWIHSPSHFAFWVMMVAYALTNKKILLCRGMDIAGRVVKIAEEIVKDCADEAKQKQIDEAKQKRIFVCANPQKFSVSTGNFLSYEDYLKIEKMKFDAENCFRALLGMDPKVK